MAALARDAGFAEVRTVPTSEVDDRYLAGRADGPSAAGGECILVART